MKQHNSSRRTFLKQFSLGALLAIPAAVTFGRIFTAQAQAPAAGAKLDMVDPKSPQAQALGYSPDAKKVDTKKWPKRAGAEGAKEFCHNCQFFQAPAGSDPNKIAAAPCQILMGKGVSHHGWCNSWTKKA